MLRIHDRLSFKDPVGRAYTTDRMVLQLRDNVRVYTLSESDRYLFARLDSDSGIPEAAIRQMCGSASEELAQANVLWPELVCYRQDNDMFCGFLTKAVEIPGSLIPLSEWIGQDSLTGPDIREKLMIGLNLARCIRAVHRTPGRYALGPLHPEDFHAAPDGRVISGGAYRCGLKLSQSNILFASPEYHAMDEIFPEQSDAFSFAMFFFRLITGVLPFGSHEPDRVFDQEQILDMILNGESVYYYESKPRAAALIRELFGISPELSRLFRRALDYCGRSRYEEDRPTLDEWILTLENICEPGRIRIEISK